MTVAETKILNLLKNSGYQYELYEHEPMYTCEQAAKIRGITLDKGIKCLLLKADKNFILILTRGGKKVNLKKIASLESVKKIQLANDEEIERVAECKKGCVHPFCNVKTYIDKILLEIDNIEFNPGCHDKSIKIKVKDLVNLIPDQVIENISL